jgi:hypothetical protein
VKKFILVCILLILPSTVGAQSKEIERPYWTFELKGGVFAPDIDNWADFYGKKDTSAFGGSLGYKILRQLEVGIEGIYIRDTGKGFAPGHGEITGNVEYTVAPLNVFLLVRGIFAEEQWVVPYVGGGWTRMFYREEIQNQGVIRGSVDGYHARGGLQFSLDVLDPQAANNLKRDYGIDHTYLFIEAEYIRAMVDTVTTPSESVNLGGISWLGGLLFEF